MQFIIFCLLLGQPQITVTERNIDLGIQIDQKSIDLSYQIINSGNAPLQLEKIVPNCDCGSLPSIVETLDPGEETFVSLTISLEPNGNWEKGFTIFSDDPESPTVVVTAKGESLPGMSVSPTPLIIKAGETRAILQVKSFAELKLEMLSIQSFPPLFEVDSKRRSDRGFEIEVKKPPSVIGKFEGFLMLETNIPNWESIMVPIQVTGP